MSDDAGMPGSPDAQGSGPQVERRAPRWMKVVLVVSVGLNLVVAGLVIGHAAFGPGFGRHYWAVGAAGREFWKGLPRERRGELRILLRDSGDRFRPGSRNAVQAVRNLSAAIAATPYDRARVEAALASLAAALDEMRTAGEGMVLEVLDRLDDEERARLGAIVDKRAEEIEHRMSRRE